VTSENSPSKVAATDQPFTHFISAETVVRTESEACAAPLTTKDEPGSDWKADASEFKGPAALCRSLDRAVGSSGG
jgi:hypothetical protein